MNQLQRFSIASFAAGDEVASRTPSEAENMNSEIPGISFLNSFNIRIIFKLQTNNNIILNLAAVLLSPPAFKKSCMNPRL